MALSQQNPPDLPVLASSKPWTIKTGCWSQPSDHPYQLGAGQHSQHSPGCDCAQSLVVASQYNMQGMHEKSILVSLVHDACLTSGSKAKSNIFNIFCFLRTIGGRIWSLRCRREEKQRAGGVAGL